MNMPMLCHSLRTAVTDNKPREMTAVAIAPLTRTTMHMTPDGSAAKFPLCFKSNPSSLSKYVGSHVEMV